MWAKLAAQAPFRQNGLRCKLSTEVKANINFNSKHLGKGDPLPPYNGILRVYNMRFCPFAQRTILALNAKDIKYEIVNINLMNKPDWLFQKSPYGKVPALEVKENVTIYESLVTVEYLDDVYPNRPLLHKDPYLKARAKMHVEASGGIINLFFKLVKRPNDVTDVNISAFRSSLDNIQRQLKDGGTPFLHGDEPGYADYMIFPWFERLKSTEGIDDRAVINSKDYSLLLNYIENMMKDPAVSQYLIPKEILKKFHEGFQNTNGPDYELLNNKKKIYG